jgi:ligand-binding SRPBCC domain-containing protein
MVRIYLETYIEAPIERVFDLSRSIDLHQHSTRQTNEKAIAGRLSGLIEQGESVTWRAKHLGVYQQLSVTIPAMNRPHSFTDRMLRGAFASMQHEHLFAVKGSGTRMTDILNFAAPLGILGRLAEWLFLKKYMTRFLLIRNETIKTAAESEEWRKFAPHT